MPQRRTDNANKKISVMAWIEDACGSVVFVRQAKGSRSWTLPGGKVKTGEALVNALRREVREEIGAQIAVASLIDILDRPAAGSLTILYRVRLKPGPLKARLPEIEKVEIRRSLPKSSTQTASYFWKRAQQCFEPLAHFAYPTVGTKRHA
jgi:ADP-ribose pyrophosphatase YjhB (NUDIX family)